jgi:hypothetical protein
MCQRMKTCRRPLPGDRPIWFRLRNHLSLRCLPRPVSRNPGPWPIRACSNHRRLADSLRLFPSVRQTSRPNLRRCYQPKKGKRITMPWARRHHLVLPKSSRLRLISVPTLERLGSPSVRARPRAVCRLPLQRRGGRRCRPVGLATTSCNRLRQHLVPRFTVRLRSWQTLVDANR